MSRNCCQPPVNASQPLIFLHLPKTAGVTLNTIIERHFPSDAVYRINIGNETFGAFFKLTEHERGNIGYLTGHAPFGLHRWLPRPATYITLLRDPVERVLSEYFFIRLYPEHPLHHQFHSENVSLDDYVEAHEFNLMTRWLCGFFDGDKTWAGVHDMPPEAYEAASQTARHNLTTHFSLVGLTEHFDQFMLLIRRLFGWQDIFYVKQNVTASRPSIAELPPQTIARIQELNKFDIELYEFGRRIFESQLRKHGVTSRELTIFRLLNWVYGLKWQAKRLLTRLKVFQD